MKYKAVMTLIVAMSISGCGEDKAPTGPVDPGHGLEAAFLGNWQVAFPEAEGVIVNVPRVSCDAPITITALETDIIAYKSPKSNSPVRFDLMEFEGRVTWMPETGTTSIAEAKGENRFLLYPVSTMGKADWDNPMEYTRCPDAA